MTEKNFISAAGLFSAWKDDVLSGRTPILWRVGTGFDPVEIGPGLVIIVGGAPGAGKTGVAMQWILDALRLNPMLRVLVANVEMTPETLLNRQLARLSGLDSGLIRFGKIAGHETRILAALNTLENIAPRLAFHAAAPTLASVAESVDAFGAELVCLDYIQRFSVGSGNAPSDKRAELDCVMGYIRRFADSGLGVLAVSAVARQNGKGGSNYAGLGLASFRGSSELEYGADSAWILEADTENFGAVNLTCVKNRHGETPGLLVLFDKPRQSFTVKQTPATAPPKKWYECDDGEF